MGWSGEFDCDIGSREWKIGLEPRVELEGRVELEQRVELELRIGCLDPCGSKNEMYEAAGV